MAEDLVETKTSMKRHATDLMAGAIIVSKDFPRKAALPRFFPQPFNNFGHFYLFDHARFLQIIFQTVMEIKNMNTAARGIRWKSWVWAGGVFALTPIFSLMTSPGLVVLAIGAAFITHFIANALYSKNLNKQIARHKAAVAEKLLRQEWKKNNQISIPRRLIESFGQSGDGEIAGDLTPVLIMFNNEQPFPGFGSLQLDNKFICRPKDEQIVREKQDAGLVSAVIEKLKTSFATKGINHVGFGKVVVINYDSISIDSPWLDKNKIPVLYQPIDQKDGFYELDESASARLYSVVEVLFPEYDSAACFFIRPFKAGNAAGCHIAITTLGPPVSGASYIRNRLVRFKVKEDAGAAKNFAQRRKDVGKNTTELELSVIGAQYSDDFHGFLASHVVQALDPLEEKEYSKERLDKTTKEILKFETFWPGKYYYFKYNIRERKSLTMGGDFFGYPELTGTISTIYDQLSRTILEAIEEQGFDISNYKDKDGKVSIKAESIDKLFIGEVIHMNAAEGGDAASKKKEETKTKK